MHHVGVVEDTDDLTDGVSLADVREELVAQTLTLTGPAHDPSDVDETHRGRNLLGRAEDLGQGGKPVIGHPHNTHIGFDGGEGIVRGEHVIAGEGVEQCRLADVGQAHDSDGESHLTTLERHQR